MQDSKVAMFLVFILTSTLVGSISLKSDSENNLPQIINPKINGFEFPDQAEVTWLNSDPWWVTTSLDQDRNGIHDSIQNATSLVNIGISFSRDVTEEDKLKLISMGFEIRLELKAVNALLLGPVGKQQAFELSNFEDVIMVERYGSVILYGDIQTPSVKASNSSNYPGAWDLGVTGKGVNIALTDTGVDNEHPGLSEKFVAGYDAVCYNPSDPNCVLAGFGLRPTDGTFDPDDANQHGTACMGMASSTGIEADGSISNFTGAAPDAKLIDVRIGTDLGAGPFENYLLEQEFYESAMNGIQWIIDHRDDAWQGAEQQDYGIDIISLSWGITSHEDGGSDGTDMHSRILDEAMEVGISVSVAAGNDGPDNDGLSGMGSSSLSITVGATDDQNTIDRSDDTVASYSSRGQRKDNGNGNPLDELKPEISAPGSNIIQAEACVTSGGCNNFIGGDASQNTYTGRGSGTSYATPSVSGIIALIIEANEDLTPVQIKEILKQTSERKGEPSAPDIDPYWNRDFGYGMVDAYAAVSLAIHLKETNQTISMNPYIQNHLLNLYYENTSSCSDCLEIMGHTWGQMGNIEGMQYRIDEGVWNFFNPNQIVSENNESSSEVGSLTPLIWNLPIYHNQLSSGFHEIEIRATSDNQYSLPVLVTVYSSSNSVQNQSFSILTIISLCIFVSVAGYSIILQRKNSTFFGISDTQVSDSDDALDAQLIHD
jgi:subtilisin family serine protease